MSITVIILNYNSSADCRKCIGYLKKQEGIELEIIVVDNCSCNEERTITKQLCEEQHCTFIANNENRGYNAGNNTGLRYAAAKGYQYALIANPDMEFSQVDYIEKLVMAMHSDKDIVVVGSDIVTPEGIHQNPKYRGEIDWRKSFHWIPDMLHRNRQQQGDVPAWVINPLINQYCRCLNGCCFLIDLAFIAGLGFFDEETFLYGEEPILGRQVELAGKKMYYTTSTYAVHHHLKSKEGSRSFCFKHWKHSQLLFIRKYSGLSRWGKWVSSLSVHCYFATLRIHHFLLKR